MEKQALCAMEKEIYGNKNVSLASQVHMNEGFKQIPVYKS